MFNKLVIMIFVLYCLSFCLLAEEQNIPEQWYVASKNSEVFHYQWCEWAKKILEENKIYFKTYNEALEVGKRSCRICQPTPEYTKPIESKLTIESKTTIESKPQIKSDPPKKISPPIESDTERDGPPNVNI